MCLYGNVKSFVEIEQLRGPWITQNEQPLSIYVFKGHAKVMIDMLTIRKCDSFNCRIVCGMLS